jgi:hypothetical protein
MPYRKVFFSFFEKKEEGKKLMKKMANDEHKIKR